MFAKDSSAFLLGNKITYFVQKCCFDLPRIFEFLGAKFVKMLRFCIFKKSLITLISQKKIVEKYLGKKIVLHLFFDNFDFPRKIVQKYSFVKVGFWTKIRLLCEN